MDGYCIGYDYTFEISEKGIGWSLQSMSFTEVGCFMFNFWTSVL